MERTVAAYFEFVTREGAAFRMVFESDLTRCAQVRSSLDAVEMNCAEAIAEVIAEDTGVDDERALLLGSALAGMAQVAARHWLAQDGDVPEPRPPDDQRARLAWPGLVPEGRWLTGLRRRSALADAGMPAGARGLA